MDEVELSEVLQGEEIDKLLSSIDPAEIESAKDVTQLDEPLVVSNDIQERVLVSCRAFIDDLSSVSYLSSKRRTIM